MSKNLPINYSKLIRNSHLKQGNLSLMFQIEMQCNIKSNTHKLNFNLQIAITKAIFIVKIKELIVFLNKQMNLI